MGRGLRMSVNREGEGLLCLFRVRELGHHLTQRRLGAGLSPYQAVS